LQLISKIQKKEHALRHIKYWYKMYGIFILTLELYNKKNRKTASAGE
jgi:hypothetical protein